MPNDRKIRYAVVGAGWITQETVLPAFRNSRNSEVAALVTHDPEKARELTAAYGIGTAVTYSEYDSLLRGGTVDAVYIALPNSMHADFTVRAARAGKHVLCEKPMAANSRECEDMIHAVETARIKLMIAYRLHFEPANLKIVELITSGRLGEPRVFSSIFSQQVKAGNVRLSRKLAGGPLMDMGVYPINAARYVFRDEPVEVMAFGANSGDRRFAEVHEGAGVLLRFPNDRLASFTVSFGAAPSDAWHVAGTKGWARIEPGFDYHAPMMLKTVIDGEEREEKIETHDQFGAELVYFSDCILTGRDPEPSGREGLADVRIVEALLESMRKGAPVQLPPYSVERRPEASQKIELPPVEPAEIVHAGSPGGD